MAQTEHLFLTLVLAFSLLFLACNDDDDDDDAADDDTNSETPSCDPGYVLTADLPDEFMEEYPDGCVPEDCGAGRWGNLETDGDTVYVDAYAGEDGDGSESAPFALIRDGLDTAGEAGGGIVAVAAGTYFENLSLTAVNKDIHLAGRCLDLVTMDGSNGEHHEAVLYAYGYSGTEEWMVSGVTVRGAPLYGILLVAGHLHVASASLLQNNAVGVLAEGNGTELILDDVEISETLSLDDGTLGRGIDIQGGARLEMSSCVVERNHGLGILIAHQGTEASLEDVEVRDTQTTPDGAFGRGIEVEFGARLEASSCLVEGSTDIGIFVYGEGTEVVLTEVEVRHTQSSPAGTFGRGISVVEGARLEASSSVVGGNTEVGIVASGEGTVVVLQGVEVRDTQPMPNDMFGRGINVYDGARLEASSCVVEGNTEIGIYATHEGTEVVLVGVEVRDTLPSPDGTLGRGIDVDDGARLEASSCVVEGNTEAGLFATDEGTEVVLVGVDVRDTLPTQAGTGGRGIEITYGAHLEASSCLVDGNTDSGILAAGSGTEISLLEVEVRNTQPLLDDVYQRGIGVQEGAHLVASSCVVEHNYEVGIIASDEGTEAILQDVEVRDTQPATDGLVGRGILVADGAHMEASSCLVENNAEGGIFTMFGGRLDAYSCSVVGNAETGIVAENEGTVVVLHDVEVRDTQRSWDGKLGRGIEVAEGAYLEAWSCVVRNNHEIGIFATHEGTEVVLEDVEILDTRRAFPMTVGLGIGSQLGASTQATDLVVTGTEGPGLFATVEGVIECSNCQVLNNSFAGALVWAGATLTLSETDISGTHTDANEGGGIGVYASDAGGSSTLTIVDTMVGDQPYAALWLDGDGSYEIRDSGLVGGYGLEREYPNGITDVLHGDGVVATGGITAWDGTNGLLLENNTIQDAYRAGVILDGSSAELATASFSNNPTDLIWQRCTGVEEPGGLGNVPVLDYCPAYNHGVAPLEFNLYLEEADPLDDKAVFRSITGNSPALPLSRMSTSAPISDIHDPAPEQLAGIPQIHDPPRPE